MQYLFHFVSGFYINQWCIQASYDCLQRYWVNSLAVINLEDYASCQIIFNGNVVRGSLLIHEYTPQYSISFYLDSDCQWDQSSYFLRSFRSSLVFLYYSVYTNNDMDYCQLHVMSYFTFACMIILSFYTMCCLPCRAESTIRQYFSFFIGTMFQMASSDAAIADLIQFVPLLLQIPDFAIDKGPQHYSRTASILYGWCDTGGSSSYTNSSPHIDSPIWPKVF